MKNSHNKWTSEEVKALQKAIETGRSQGKVMDKLAWEIVEQFPMHTKKQHQKQNQQNNAKGT